MIRRVLGFQLSRMVRCREYQVAMLLSSLVACGAFLAEAAANTREDRSVILSASMAACGCGLSQGWGINTHAPKSFLICSALKSAWVFNQSFLNSARRIPAAESARCKFPARQRK